MSARPTDRNDGRRRTSPVGGLAAVLVVTLTLLLGLYMAQADGLQVRNTLPQLPTRISEALAVFPTRPMPTATPTLAPSATTPPPTASSSATPPPSPTASMTAETTPTRVSPADCPERLSDWVAYIVERNDTVESIAAEYNVEISFFREVNCLGDAEVTAGLELFVPTVVEIDTDTCVVQIPAGWVPYTVRSGDNIFRLALSTNTTEARLRTVNCLAGELFAGTTIYLPFRPGPLPTATPLPATATPVPPPPTNTPPPPPPPTETPVPPTSTPPPPPSPTPVPTTPAPTETPVPTPTDPPATATLPPS